MNKSLFLIVLCTLMSCIKGDIDAEKYIKIAHDAIFTDSKEIHDERLKNLIELIGDLSDDERKHLFSSLVTNLRFEDDNPFSDQSSWVLIGVILFTTKSDQLTIEILRTAPPSRVGFMTLSEFIKQMDEDIIVKILTNNAIERRSILQILQHGTMQGERVIP